MTTPKPRLKSKTLWASGALAAFALAVLGLPELAGWVETLPVNIQAIAWLAIGGLGLLLRETTSQPLGGWIKPPVKITTPEAASKTSQKPPPAASKKPVARRKTGPRK